MSLSRHRPYFYFRYDLGLSYVIANYLREERRQNMKICSHSNFMQNFLNSEKNFCYDFLLWQPLLSVCLCSYKERLRYHFPNQTFRIRKNCYFGPSIRAKTGEFWVYFADQHQGVRKWTPLGSKGLNHA